MHCKSRLEIALPEQLCHLDKASTHFRVEGTGVEFVEKECARGLDLLELPLLSLKEAQWGEMPATFLSLTNALTPPWQTCSSCAFKLWKASTIGMFSGETREVSPLGA
jgi:hypothetical protein